MRVRHSSVRSMDGRGRRRAKPRARSSTWVQMLSLAPCHSRMTSSPHPETTPSGFGRYGPRYRRRRACWNRSRQPRVRPLRSRPRRRRRSDDRRSLDAGGVYVQWRKTRTSAMVWETTAEAGADFGSAGQEATTRAKGWRSAPVSDAGPDRWETPMTRAGPYRQPWPEAVPQWRMEERSGMDEPRSMSMSMGDQKSRADDRRPRGPGVWTR